MKKDLFYQVLEKVPVLWYLLEEIGEPPDMELIHTTFRFYSRKTRQILLSVTVYDPLPWDPFPIFLYIQLPGERPIVKHLLDAYRLVDIVRDILQPVAQ